MGRIKIIRGGTPKRHPCEQPTTKSQIEIDDGEEMEIEDCELQPGDLILESAQIAEDESS